MRRSTLEVSFDENDKLMMAHFIDYHDKTLTRADRLFKFGDREKPTLTTMFSFIKSKIESPQLPDLVNDQNPAEWTEEQAYTFVKSKIKSAQELLVDGKRVDVHEFNRRLFNSELKCKLTIPELEEAKKAGGEIARTVDKITFAKFISAQDYQQLVNYDQKHGCKLGL